MRRILFVCLGNICRSPTAEAIFRHLLTNKSLESRYSCESAGTAAYHVGHSPDPRSRQAGEQRGYRFETRARQFTLEDFQDFDWIVAMDDSNLHNLRRLDKEGKYSSKLFRMVDFLRTKKAAEIPDPYYGGEGGFENVLDLLEEACDGLLEQLEKTQES